MKNTKLWISQKNIQANNSSFPVPTNKLEQLKLDLDIHGFCLYKSNLSTQTIQNLHQRVKQQVLAEERLGLILKNETGSKICTNLLNKGDAFISLVTESHVDSLIEHLLGKNFLISGLNSIETSPQTRAQGLHMDQAFLQFPAPIPFVANALWMIDDFKPENGGTQVIPGSHLWPMEKISEYHTDVGLPDVSLSDLIAAPPQQGINHPEAISLTAPAGTCLIIDGRLLHGTGQNKTTDQARLAISGYYCRPYMRQILNPFISIDDHVLLSFPNLLKEKLGYRTWSYFGGCQIPGVSLNLDVVKPKNLIGELT